MINELSDGIFEITLDSEYIDKEILIVAEKSGYFSNSVLILLGEWIPLEEETTEMIIPGFILPILFIMLLGIITILVKKTI